MKPAPFPTPPTTSPRTRWRLRWWHLPTAAVVLGMVLIGTVILSFRMGGGARILRNAVEAAQPGTLQREIELGVGRLPLGLVKTIVALAPVEPEARAAIRSLRYADVGIYHLDAGHSITITSAATFIASVREHMERRGWDPVVSVVDGSDQVYVFVPRTADELQEVEAAVLVADGDKVIIASGALNLEHLMDLIARQGAMPHLACLKL